MLALCAVLAGLFLMHGFPANAAGGCHGEATPLTASAPAPMSMSGTGAGPETAVAHAAGHAPVVAGTARDERSAQAGPAVSRTGGETCVSTPARDRLPLPSADAVLVFGLAALFMTWLIGCRPGAAGRAYRGPPWSGRGLLIQVCVART
ncbi:hypothetical protein [Streptomyces xanthii]|uniref:hypothetical protein n=1 Tax=Streptomyces xanthii TaxID=2768069 RepID=UPI001CB7ABF8|nr:hypothetical protein [Streptomyces xanthii]